MEIILVIALILLFIIAIIVPVFIMENIDNIKWYHYILIGILIMVLAISASCIANTTNNYNKPKAIDVYRNKTTLKITYIDSIPQDTTVVFK